MYGYHVVAVFDTYGDAERAKRKLTGQGIDMANGENGERDGLGEPGHGSGGIRPIPAPESGPSGGGDTSADSDTDTGDVPGSNKMRKDYGGPGEDLSPERIQRDLDKYRDEMAEDAPASGTPEDRS